MYSSSSSYFFISSFLFFFISKLTWKVTITLPLESQNRHQMNIENLSTIYQQGICHGLYKDMLCINFYQCSFKDIAYARQFEELPFDKTSSLRVIYKDKQLCTKQQNFYLVWLLNSKWDIFLNTLITTKTHRTFQTRSRNVKPELIPAAAAYMRPIQLTFKHRWERWSTHFIPL